MKPKRITSPKGVKLHTGEANRQAILAALPGTTRHIINKTGIERSVVGHALERLRKTGDVVVDENAVPVEGGGTPQRLWRLPQWEVRTANDSPWYNAWEARRPTVSPTGSPSP